MGNFYTFKSFPLFSGFFIIDMYYILIVIQAYIFNLYFYDNFLIIIHILHYLLDYLLKGQQLKF